MKCFSDPYLTLSFINTKLRDQYASLDVLCEDLNLNKEEVLKQLKTIDYIYDETKNAFVYRQMHSQTVDKKPFNY